MPPPQVTVHSPVYTKSPTQFTAEKEGGAGDTYNTDPRQPTEKGTELNSQDSTRLLSRTEVAQYPMA